jgi:hypothetical protein
LFIDIDGVVLHRRRSGMFDGFELVAGCRQGWPDGSRRAFLMAGAPLDDPRWGVLNLIEPAVWRVNKTEAISPVSDFWWVEDNPSEHDRSWLRTHDRQGSAYRDQQRPRTRCAKSRQVASSIWLT